MISIKVEDNMSFHNANISSYEIKIFSQGDTPNVENPSQEEVRT